MIKLRAAIRRWSWLLALGIVVGAVVGAASVVLTPERKPSYDASSVVLFDLSRASSAAQEAAAQAGLRVTRGTVPLRAAQLLGGADPKALVATTSVEVDGTSLSLTIRSSASTREKATAIADAFTTAFLETSNQQEIDALDRQLTVLQRQVQSAQRRLNEFDAANPGVAALTDSAIPLVKERSDLLTQLTDTQDELTQTQNQRDSTVGPYSRLGEPTVSQGSGGVLTLPSSPLARVGLLTVVGLGLAALLVGLLERANPRIDSKEEAQEALGVPVLAMVPRLGRSARRRTEHVTAEHFTGGYAESYRRLRSAIQFVSSQGPPNDAAGASRASSFLVVSPSPSEGKTTTVAYTGYALAEADVPALALNADTRKPTLHERLGVAPQPGLSELAELRLDRPTIDDVAQQGPVDGLFVVASGRPAPLTTELVAAVGEVVREATSRGATVLVDSSPILATADAMELLPLVDHVIMVVRNGRTTRREALEGLEMLRQRDARVLGCVCIGAHESRRRYTSYYDSDYHRPAGEDPDGGGPWGRPPAPPPSGVAPVAVNGSGHAPAPPPYPGPAAPARPSEQLDVTQ